MLCSMPCGWLAEGQLMPLLALHYWEHNYCCLGTGQHGPIRPQDQQPLLRAAHSMAGAPSAALAEHAPLAAALRKAHCA
jgi:hypothetical protein